MPDYMTLHASAYPPTSWTVLANRQPKPPQTSNNELWTEMTNQYEQSMAKRHHEITSNYLSETATNDNIDRMSPEVQRLYRQRPVIAFRDAADIEEVLEIADQFVEAVDKLSKNPMESIPEEDEFGATHSRRQETKKESLQIKQAILNVRNYDKLLESTDKIERSFRDRLLKIQSICYDFIFTSPGNHPRPRWAQVSRIGKEVTAHVARVAHVQQQVTSDVTQLRNFLREQLFDEYCLMRGTTLEKKDKTWLQYGKCLLLEQGIGKGENSSTKETAENFNLGDREVGERLARMIKASGLEPDWVMDHIEDYHAGNDHIGRWQRYAQDCRWHELAAKLIDDIKQLEKINSTIDWSDGRRCKIMSIIRNTKRQFFERLDGAQNFELSEKASEMNKQYRRTLPSSSTKPQ